MDRRRRRACRTQRGRSEAGAPPRSARALPCAQPLRTRRTRKRGPARGSPPALTIYSQALCSALRPRRACADLAAPLPLRGPRPEAPPPEVSSPGGPMKRWRERRFSAECLWVWVVRLGCGGLVFGDAEKPQCVEGGRVWESPPCLCLHSGRC